jgi:murein DD-endopeptidase MepM/ murein hydrolase activator NlpD
MSEQENAPREGGHQSRIKLRSAGSPPTIVLTLPLQIALGTLIFATSAWLTIATVSYFGSRTLLVDKADYIASLEQEAVALRQQSQAATLAFLDEKAALERDNEAYERTVGDLQRIVGSLEQQLASRQRQIESLAAERSEAEATLTDLAASKADGRAELTRLINERAFLGSQLRAAQERLAEVSYQRDNIRRAEHGLRWEIARLKSQIESRTETAELWFEEWVTSSVASLEQLFIATGIDVEVLVARAAESEVAQGGPFQGTEPPVAEPDLPAVDPLAQRIRRLTALQRLTSATPLSSPLDHFHVTSGFGKRRDPFTGRWAFHSGLDMGAAPGSAVLATAPGMVVNAGHYGPYGNMVEIDHGMGVTTRYGHLEEIDVKVGDEVQFRQQIGVIGNTGRSTARHLHYEVRMDDKAYDPAKFLEAGRYLVDVFNFRQFAGEPGGG